MTPSTCPRCDAGLPLGELEGLCPACLLTQAGDEPDHPGANVDLHSGQTIGPYRIHRILGRGGMGRVYEAEHLEHGRRVALKVLSTPLAGPQDRQRFLREGQLAASINHPNSVYIFCSDEIEGTAVIAMELLPGGSLKDRVAENGPLAPVEAVDAILQVIAGLDAGHTAGVLHRDVKPSNCFVASDGTVKIGDFGLSISTLRREPPDTVTGSFQGTPQFAAPEQLRGEPLDVRADIYSVGATLYYLLTGQPPFDRANLVALVTEIATAPRPSAHAIQPVVPRELARIVQRSLARDRADRPATYAELTDLLRPFSSALATPAPIGARVAASAFDLIVIGGAVLVAGLFAGAFLGRYPLEVFPYGWAFVCIAAAYWTVTHSVWGKSYGEWSCGIHVTTDQGRRPGVARAAARAVAFSAPAWLAGLVHMALPVIGDSTSTPYLPLLAFVGAAGLLWTTARPRNAYAGLHDAISGTRVVLKAPREAATTVPSVPIVAASREDPTHRTIGLYAVVAPLGATDIGQLLLAVDPRLQRLVWIHEVPLSTPPVPDAMRDISRPGRLRWLNGRRSYTEAWDVWEAPAGEPLLSAVGRPQPWRVVRAWLGCVARECQAADRDGTTPTIDLRCVWISTPERLDPPAEAMADAEVEPIPAARAILLEWPAPGVAGHSSQPQTVNSCSVQQFLLNLARRALGTPAPTALPLSARAFLERLEAGAFTSTAELVAALDDLERRPDPLTHRRRNMALALSVVSTAVAVLALRPALAAVAVTAGLAFPGWLTPLEAAVLFCALLSVASAATLRSGLWLRVFGIAVLTRDGAEASRLRAAARALVAWSWLLILPAADFTSPAAALAALVGMVAIAYAGDHPDRGPHDIVSATWLAPR